LKSLIALPSTISLLVQCWEAAEERVCHLVTDRYTVHDEVFITRLFCGELGWLLRQESECGKFSAAFLEDLGTAFRNVTSSHKGVYQELRRISSGLIARIRYHEPAVEGMTGGDLGIAVMRPNVRMGKTNQLTHELHEQGLLCQAKRQARSRTWGSLTNKQKEVLPGRLFLHGLAFVRLQ
jgi:hypothetical protein